MRGTILWTAALCCAAALTAPASAAEIEVAVEVTQVMTHPYFAVKFWSADGEVRGTGILEFAPNGEIPVRHKAGSLGRMRAAPVVLETSEGKVRVRFGRGKWRRAELKKEIESNPGARGDGDAPGRVPMVELGR